MQRTAVTVNKIDAESNSFTLSVLELTSINKGMVLVPNFDPDVMPLALSQGADGHYQLTDIRGRGWVGQINGLEEVEVLGQPPQKKDWIFVKSHKTGALGIVKISKIN